MSDYIYMLESHLSQEQNQAVALVTAVAGQMGVTAFLTGGAVRDMIAGQPIRDLDFTIDGAALKMAKFLADKHHVRILSTDEDRKSAELSFPGGVAASIGMSQEVKYGKQGSKPQVRAASIHEDLRGRDFTINSVALSLNAGSRGLPQDPTNGLGDLERKELCANSNYTLYDDPSRLLRMFRLQVRLGLTISERTMSQYQNVREAKLEEKIPSKIFLKELRLIADEPNPGELLSVLDREGLLALFSPSLTGESLNVAGFKKLQATQQLVPFGVSFKASYLGLFLFILTEKLSAREKSAFTSKIGLAKSDVEAWQKLEARSRKLETALKSAKLKKASLVYQLLRDSPGEDVLFLMMRTSERLVHDRIKNFLTKYLSVAHEVPEKDLLSLGLDPNSAKYKKAKDDLICAYLDGRIRKPEPPPEPVLSGPGGPRGNMRR
jgi:tRNA nucleotidyltransferase/poly(A) polymerase